MSQSVEEVAGSYQTYRALSEDEDFEFPITELIYAEANRNYQNDKLFLGLQADETVIYLLIDMGNKVPNKQFATIEDIFGDTEEKSFSSDSFLRETVTVHIDENIKKAELKGHSTSEEFIIRQEDPKEKHSDKNITTQEDIPEEKLNEFSEKCSISYWYHMAESVGEHGRKTQIKEVLEVEDGSVLFSVDTGKYDTTVKLPIPDNANSDSNFNAEFIEDCSGDIRLLDGNTAVLLPTKESSKTKRDGLLTDSELFEVYSPEQYNSYVSEHEPSQSSRSPKTTNTTSNDRGDLTAKEKQNVGKSILKGGIVLFLTNAVFKVTAIPIVSSAAPSMESAQYTISLMAGIIDIFILLGMLLAPLGVMIFYIFADSD